jgi:hypothetical protein
MNYLTLSDTIPAPAGKVMCMQIIHSGNSQRSLNSVNTNKF